MKNSTKICDILKRIQIWELFLKNLNCHYLQILFEISQIFIAFSHITFRKLLNDLPVWSGPKIWADQKKFFLMNDCSFRPLWKHKLVVDPFKKLYFEIPSNGVIRDTFQVSASIMRRRVDSNMRFQYSRYFLVEKHHGIQIRNKPKSVSNYPVWRFVLLDTLNIS